MEAGSAWRKVRGVSLGFGFGLVSKGLQRLFAREKALFEERTLERVGLCGGGQQAAVHSFLCGVQCNAPICI
jgi:hypothetical protein